MITPSSTITTTADIENDGGVANEAFEKDDNDVGDDDEDSDVSTTIIDGKRAVSLHNFGKFEAQQKREAKEQNAVSYRNRNAATLQR